MIDFEARRKLYKKFFVMYFGIFLMILVALGFSYGQGADWRPVIVGIPVYLTFFIVVTYQFIKEWRKTRRKERGELEPPPRKGPWDKD